MCKAFIEYILPKYDMTYLWINGSYDSYRELSALCLLSQYVTLRNWRVPIMSRHTYVRRMNEDDYEDDDDYDASYGSSYGKKL